MLGAVCGDMVGSLYAFAPSKTKKFDFLDVRSHFTDDTIFMAAVANIMRQYKDSGKTLDFKAALQEELLRISWLYQDMAYSRFFSQWMFEDEPKPYGSAGVIAASRACPIGFLADSLEEAETLAKWSAEITHNHPEGIKGAQAVAAGIFLARSGKTKEAVRGYIESLYYKLDFTMEDLRRQYQPVFTCPGCVPPAFVAFLFSEDFTDAIRNAIGMGGADSLAAITGGLAEAFYGLPPEIAQQTEAFLDEELKNALVGG